MEYHVGYLDVLTSMFSSIQIVIIIGVVVLLTTSRKKLQIKILAMILIIVVFLGVIISNANSGWLLEGNNLLKVKALEPRTIQLSEARIDLVDSNGQWQVSRKRVGYNAENLNIGFFFLKNGTPAMVFQHLTSPKTILILANDEYITLSYPGVESLYYELLNRGVQKITQ